MKRSVAMGSSKSSREVLLTGKLGVLSHHVERSKKRRREHHKIRDYAFRPFSPSYQTNKSGSLIFQMLPIDVLESCFEFISTSRTRFSACLVCKTFYNLHNSKKILRVLDIEDGEQEGEEYSILKNCSKDDAMIHLLPLVRAGNVSALYMMGSIRCYCFEDFDGGVELFRKAAALGDMRSTYSLGLILRDSLKHESAAMLGYACKEKFLPALQEIYPTQEIKEKYGESSANKLEIFFDPPSLHKLLARSRLEHTNHSKGTLSHCWNPKCGRWAYKVDTLSQSRAGQCFEAEFLDKIDSYGINSDDMKAKLPIFSQSSPKELRMSRMKMCSRCRKAKYCSKLCQVYDWRSGRHKRECAVL